MEPKYKFLSNRLFNLYLNSLLSTGKHHQLGNNIPISARYKSQTIRRNNQQLSNTTHPKLKFRRVNTWRALE